jgi:hypothetical protein
MEQKHERRKLTHTHAPLFMSGFFLSLPLPVGIRLQMLQSLNTDLHLKLSRGLPGLSLGLGCIIGPSCPEVSSFLD